MTVEKLKPIRPRRSAGLGVAVVVPLSTRQATSKCWPAAAVPGLIIERSQEGVPRLILGKPEKLVTSALEIVIIS
jgi:hypothetical protein